MTKQKGTKTMTQTSCVTYFLVISGDGGGEVCACGRQPCLSKAQGWGRVIDLWKGRQPQWRRVDTKALLFSWDNTWLRPWVYLLACFGLLNLEKELFYRSISTSWVCHLITELHDGCRLLTLGYICALCYICATCCSMAFPGAQVKVRVAFPLATHRHWVLSQVGAYEKTNLMDKVLVKNTVPLSA